MKEEGEIMRVKKDFSKAFSPLYVLISGSVGMFIIFTLFYYKFPDATDEIGMAFVSRPEFPIWVFMHAILACVVTITFFPLWGILIEFVRDQMKTESANRNRKTVFNLIFQGVVLATFIFSVLGFLTIISYKYFDQSLYIPKNFYNRVLFILSFPTLSSLPALLGIMSIHTAVGKVSQKIDTPDQAKEELFSLQGELQHYRFLLQGYLLFLGVILSMAAITGVGYRAIFVGLGAKEIEYFPVTHAMGFGLVFTILLLLVYLPVHFALTETSRKLRDRICPITSIETLQEVMAKRKYLDEMLQTNVDIMSNFKSGFMTLAPFLSSILASFLGDISL